MYMYVAMLNLDVVKPVGTDTDVASLPTPNSTWNSQDEKIGKKDEKRRKKSVDTQQTKRDEIESVHTHSMNTRPSKYPV